MKIQKSLVEIEKMLSEQSGKTITFRQVVLNQVVVSYWIDFNLTLIGHTHQALQFTYKLNWSANLLAKSAGGLFGNVKTKKLSIDTKAQTITLNLAVFAEYKDILNTHQISEAKIDEQMLTLTLEEKH